MEILKEFVREHSERNRTGALSNVHSVTNSRGFVPSIDYFNKEVFSSNLKNYKVVHKGMLAYNPSRINVGSVALLDSADTVIVSPLYVVVEVIKDCLLPEYLNAFLHSPTALSQIKVLTSGSVRDSLRYSSFELLQLPVPHIKQQRVVVLALDKVFNLIAKCDEQIVRLDKLVKSRFVEMFGDVTVNDREWETATLPELGELNRGVSKARPRNSPELLGGPYPLVQTGDVSNSGLWIKNYSSTYSDKGLAQSRLWKRGTLCITIAANIAQTAILDFDACFPDSVGGFVPNERTDAIFIHYWFSFFQKILEAQAPQVAQKNINLRILSGLKVVEPPLALQREFAAFVARVDKLALRAKGSLEKLETLKKALMQKYFG